MTIKIDSKGSLFAVQTFFSFIGVTFSIIMLSVGKDPSIYLPILTGIIGYWVPSPGSHYQTKNKDPPPTYSTNPLSTVAVEQVIVQ